MDGTEDEYRVSKDILTDTTDGNELTLYFDRHTGIKLQAIANTGYRIANWYLSYYSETTGEYVLSRTPLTSGTDGGYKNEILNIEYIKGNLNGTYVDGWVIIDGYNPVYADDGVTEIGKTPIYRVDENGDIATVPERIVSLYAGYYLTYLKRTDGTTEDVIFDGSHYYYANAVTTGTSSSLAGTPVEVTYTLTKPDAEARAYTTSDQKLITTRVYLNSANGKYYYDAAFTSAVPTSLADYIDPNMYSVYSQVVPSWVTNERYFEYSSMAEEGTNYEVLLSNERATSGTYKVYKNKPLEYVIFENKLLDTKKNKAIEKTMLYF